VLQNSRLGEAFRDDQLLDEPQRARQEGSDLDDPARVYMD
jgi:hypothetical protein